MTEFIHNIFSTVFGENVILATILIAMIPIIELRGAIPFATNTGFWGSYSLTNWSAFLWSLLGSCAIVPLLALLFMPLIKWMKSTKIFKKFANALESRIKSKASNIAGAEEKSKRFSKTYWKKMIGVFVFVAIPLPLTGVWTGTCIALFIGLDFISTCASVMLGNVTAGLIVTLILEFFPWLNDWLFYIFLILIAIVLLFELIKHLIIKLKNKTNKPLNNSTLSNEEDIKEQK